MNSKLKNKDKTQRKWQPNLPKKDIASTGRLFKTHLISYSESQILIPPSFPNLYKPNQLYVIQCQKGNICLQASQNQEDISHLTDISVLKTLVDLSGVQCDESGSFQGKIRILDNQVGYHVQFVQILVREIYFSRRDQYKVMKALRETQTHVFVQKLLYFDQVQLEVMSLMRNATEPLKSGIIDKDTKIIFRSGCAKSTIMLEICKEMFLMNANKQLYLEKALQFLLVYFMRNNFFQNKHHIEIILFSRLFYPKFKTLKQAYAFLVQDDISTNKISDKFQVNFAVSLQKDFKGQIYQDVYRRILWPSASVQNFSQHFWEKISEFLFTINYDAGQVNQRAKFIAKSIQGLVQMSTGKESQKKVKIKPFIHRLKCQLSDSFNSNMLEAICLIAQQYSHHYHFRSLKETGNSIVILSPGNSKYEVDQTTYKFTKSYVYLTNISCIHINLNTNYRKLIVRVNRQNKTPRYNNAQDVHKLQKLNFWGIQQSIYQSPMNQKMSFRDNFQFKSVIYPYQLHRKIKDPQRKKSEESDIKFNELEQQYELIESQNLNEVKNYQKDIDWIQNYFFGEEAFHIHELFYDKTNHFMNCFNQNGKKSNQILSLSKLSNRNNHIQDKSIKFGQQIMKILSGKNKLQNWYAIGNTKNQINKIIQNYEQNKSQQYINKKLFQLQVFSGSGQQQSSLGDTPKKIGRQRKNSQIWTKSDSKIFQSQSFQINIFQATYKNRQYQAIIPPDKDRLAKKNSHNKFRLRNNYNNNSIHYLLPQFPEIVFKDLRAVIRKQQQVENSQHTQQRFDMQRFWKNICFPILTPLYTKCNETFQEIQSNLGQNMIIQNKFDFQEKICTRLMENFQIIEQQSNMYNNSVRMSKGHIQYVINKNGPNLSVSYITDKVKQQKTIPFMLYRYLCYQEKDYRFCSKYINLQNKNFLFDKKVQLKQTKSLKVVFIKEQIYSRESLKKQQEIKQFIIALKDKYKNLNFNLTQGGPFQPSQKYDYKSLKLSNSKKISKIYVQQQIDLTIHSQANPHNLYALIIQWNKCSSSLLNQFINNVQTLGRRNKLSSYLITTQDPFQIKWSIQTMAEIVFQSSTGISLMKANIERNYEWLWDDKDFYMDWQGFAFIKIKPERKLILWKDNTYQLKAKKMNEFNIFFNRFFIQAAIYDFIGQIIQKKSFGEKQIIISL